MLVQEKKETADVVLLYPKTGLDIGGHTVAPPHGLLAIAAPVSKAGYNVKIIDMRRDDDWRTSLKNAISNDTICVGISSMTGTQIYFALMMAKEVRRLTNGRIPIVWGGIHATILPEQTLQDEHVDIIVEGEGDESFLELVQALEKTDSLYDIKGIAFKDGSKVVRTGSRDLIDVETLLPVPWHLIDVEKYINKDNYFLKGSTRTLDVGQTSRGCPFRCAFCSSSSVLKKRYRAMSVDRSMELIMEPVEKFNLSGVWVRDDEFFVKNKRAYAICEKILNNDRPIKWYSTGMRVDTFLRATDDQLDILKRSGGEILKFGAESGSNRVLDLIRKGIHVEDTLRANERAKSLGITPAYSLIVGFPTETFQEINQTIDLGYRLKRENPAAQLETIPTYTAYPGTELYGLALQNGLKPPTTLAGWADWILDDYDLTGQKIPWFNKKQRTWIGNISYMSILSNAVGNIKGGVSNPFWKTVFGLLEGPVQKVYRFRLKNKLYKFAPELKIARYLRKKIFYRSDKMIK